jgi:histone H2A
MSGRATVNRKPRRVTATTKANLIFPVTRLKRYLKKSCLNQRVQVKAAVFLAAALEYLVAEVAEISGNTARSNSKRRVSPRHIFLALSNDEDFSKLMKKVIIPEGGALPKIDESLLPKANKIKRKPKAASKIKAKVKTPKKSTAKSRRRRLGGLGGLFGVALPFGSTTGSAMPTPSASIFGMTTLSEKILTCGQKLTVVQANIASMNCDAVVHPTNNSLSLSGMCGNALSSTGGPSFTTEVRNKKANLAVGEATITGAGTLPCKKVIHVHSPSWNDTDAVPNLKKAVVSCLDIAEKENLKSVGFPSIASGSNNFPKQLAAQTILRSIRDYYAKLSGSVKQIYFVLYDTESINIYTTEMTRLDD